MKKYIILVNCSKTKLYKG